MSIVRTQLMQHDSRDDIKKLLHWLNRDKNIFFHLEIASATGKQLNIFIHSAITSSDLVWNILLKQLLITYWKDLVTVLLTGQASEP